MWLHEKVPASSSGVWIAPGIIADSPPRSVHQQLHTSHEVAIDAVSQSNVLNFCSECVRVQFSIAVAAGA